MNMLSMEKERYFSQYRILADRIAFHTEQLCHKRREIDAISSRWGEKTASYSNDAPYVKLIEKIEESEEKLKDENDLLSRLQEEMENLIANLDSEKMRFVVMYRYLEGLSFPEISKLLFVSLTTARRMRDQAFDLIALPENPINIF